MPANSLAVLWTTNDREVALTMAFMYVKNAKTQGWFQRVRLVVWGPSAEVLAMDHELHQHLPRLRTAGVEIMACKACADLFDVAERLGNLGVEVMPMGEELTTMLKDGWNVLTV